MILDIEHNMVFSYEDWVHEAWMELRVRPRTTEEQTLESFYLAVGPPSSVASYTDWNTNLVHHFGIGDYHDRVEITVRSVIESRGSYRGLDQLVSPPGPVVGPVLDFVGFGGPVRRSEALEGLASACTVPVGAPLGEQLAELGALLLSRFQYRPGVTDSASTTDDLLRGGEGVCQDFAHLALALLRLRGIACRYVSGYLHVGADESNPSQSHAWIEVMDANGGWAAFDPTHDRVPGEQYVVVGYGRNYDDVPPNRGVYRGGASESLVIEVHTRETERLDVVGYHEQIEKLDVPVHREVPGSDKARRAAPEQEQGAGQQ